MNDQTINLGFGEGLALLATGGTAMLLVMVGGSRIWKGVRDATKFWVEDEMACAMSFSQFVMAYLTKYQFGNTEGTLYKRSRNRIGVGIGIIFIAIAFYSYSQMFLLEPLENWFETIPR